MTEHPSNVFLEKANLILERYKGLVAHTGNILFPWWEINFLTSPDLTEMPKGQAQLAEHLAPYLILKKTSSTGWLKGITYYAWILAFFFWLASSVAFFQLTVSPAENTSAEPLTPVVYFLAMLIFFIPATLIHLYTIWFIFTKRNSWKNRLAWFFVLIAIGLLLPYLLDVQESEVEKFLSSNFLAFILYMSFIPGILFVTYNLLYFFKFATEIIVNTINSFIASHETVSYEVIQKVLSTPIKSKDSEWNITELASSEISSIKELSSANLEATEKKTIPIAILMALIGLLATIPSFQDFLGVATQEIGSRVIEIIIPAQNPNSSIGRIFFNIGIIGVLVFIFRTYLMLFRNLIVQGLVIQVSVIAEHAKKASEIQSTKQQKVEEFKIDSLFSFISKVLSLFRRD
ncbi:MAG: hypothetical protein IH588_11575 [Anaerolineales bacterium]|nr:hypothetical protein [Anaerolineales bacterium]